MSAKITMFLCLLVVVVSMVSAVPAGGSAGPWGTLNPWIPQWAPCTGVGSTCSDCNTKVICTKIGGFQRACNDPTLPYCNLGECSATATAECGGPVNVVPIVPVPADV